MGTKAKPASMYRRAEPRRGTRWVRRQSQPVCIEGQNPERKQGKEKGKAGQCVDPQAEEAVVVKRHRRSEPGGCEGKARQCVHPQAL